MVVDLDGDGGAGDGDKRTGRLVGKTVLDVVVDLGQTSRQVPGVKELLAGDQIGAALFTLDAGLGRVARFNAVHVQLAELTLQVLVVDHEGDAAVLVDLDKTILVVLLGPLVDKTTREGLSHFLAVQSLNFSENTGLDLVAAILREENGHGGVGEVLGEDIVTAGLVGGFSTPRVRVQTKEVGLRAGRVLHVAFEVAVSVHQNVTDISSGVTDGDGAVRVLGDIILHITDDSLYRVNWTPLTASVGDAVLLTRT